jgi:hypothetical protein
MWTVRNKVTFDGQIVRNPMEAVFTMCSFLMCWQVSKQATSRVVRDIQEIMNRTVKLSKKAKMDNAGARAMISD